MAPVLLSEQPQWLIWKAATHLWGPLVEVAKLAEVRTIFHTAFDRDVHPRGALFRRRRWWPLYAWGLARTDRIFVQHQGQLSGFRRMATKGIRSTGYCWLDGSY